jgi:hypothetical protein
MITKRIHQTMMYCQIVARALEPLASYVNAYVVIIPFYSSNLCLDSESEENHVIKVQEEEVY